MSSQKLVVVVGATGAQGGSVVSTLSKNPIYKIRAITRNTTSAAAQKLVAQGVEVVEADSEDVSSLIKAFQVRSLSFPIQEQNANYFWFVGCACHLRRNQFLGNLCNERSRSGNECRLSPWEEPRRRRCSNSNTRALHLEHHAIRNGTHKRETLIAPFRRKDESRRPYLRILPGACEENNLCLGRVLRLEQSVFPYAGAQLHQEFWKIHSDVAM